MIRQLDIFGWRLDDAFVPHLSLYPSLPCAVTNYLKEHRLQPHVHHHHHPDPNLHPELIHIVGKKDVHHCGYERPEDRRKEVLSDSEKASRLIWGWPGRWENGLTSSLASSLSLYACLINQFQAKTKHDLFLQHFMQGIFGKLSPTKIYKFLEKFQTTFDPLLFGKTLQKFAVFSWPNIDRTHYVENLPGKFLIWRMTSPPPLFETFPKNHPFWWGITSINQS